MSNATASTRSAPHKAARSTTVDGVDTVDVQEELHGVEMAGFAFVGVRVSVSKEVIVEVEPVV